VLLTADIVPTMEWLLKIENLSLDSANISLGTEITDEEGKQLSNLFTSIASIPKLTLQMEYSLNSMHILDSMQSFKVQRLDVEVLGIGNRISNYYLPLENFLKNCAAHLELLSVTLNNHLSFQYSCGVLTLPPLNKLLSLELCLLKPEEGREMFDEIEVDYDFLSPLDSNLFPNLKKIVIQNTAPVSMIGAFRDCHFDSVVELALLGYHPGDAWAPIFPNIKKLKATPKDVDEDEDDRLDDEQEQDSEAERNEEPFLFTLLNGMTKLEHLHLILSSAFGPDSPNTLLFQALLPLVSMKSEFQAIILSLMRGVSKKKSLFYIDLKSFKLEMDWRVNEFGDSGAYLTLLLPPLELFLTNITVSFQFAYLI